MRKLMKTQKFLLSLGSPYLTCMAVVLAHNISLVPAFSLYNKLGWLKYKPEYIDLKLMYVWESDFTRLEWTSQPQILVLRRSLK